jgi:hypothetical protein
MKEACRHKHVFEYPTDAPEYPKSKIMVLHPMIGVDTTSYRDITYFLNKVFRWRKQHSYQIILLFGDEQFVDRVWKIRCLDPDNWYWVIPFPGEFHFCVHIVHGIYRLFSRLLMDMAAFMERDKLKVDFLLKHFHKQEDFLLLVFESIHSWLEGVTRKPEGATPEDILKACEKNQPVHELLHLYFHFGTFYVYLRQNIRRGYTMEITAAWLYCWPLFHCTGKALYSRLSLLVAYISQFSHPVVRQQLEHRLANLKGVPGHCIGTDMVTEKV